MAHIHEKIDWTVSVFIVHKDKVLLRKHEKYGIWLGVGGHIELDEDPLIACKRECKEEVGLDITLVGEDAVVQLRGNGTRELLPPRFMNIHPINDTHSHLDLTYFATSTTDTVLPENETDVWSWLTKAEIEAHPDLPNDVRFYALEALKCATHTQ